MNKKAIEMSLSTVIIFIIVIVVLIVIIMIFTKTSNPIFDVFSRTSESAAESIPQIPLG